MAVPPPAPSDKRGLRAAMRSARARFVPAGPIRPAPEFLDRLQPGLIVASYRPMGGEADPAPLARAAAAAGCALALPHVVDRATSLRFLRWTEALALVAGPFGLEQPHHEGEEVAPDIILTPLVAFDRRGGRLPPRTRARVPPARARRRARRPLARVHRRGWRARPPALRAGAGAG